MKDPRSPGFTLIEVAIVVTIVAIVAALMAPLLAGFADADRSSKTYDDLRRLYTGITGTPANGQYGYLGDVGAYPASLLDLVRNPGVPGWNGPYVTDVSIENDQILDGFGNPVEFFYSYSSGAFSDQLGLISKGPDRISTNTSGTPNVRASYAGLPLPSSFSTYPLGVGNPDNIAYPRFTDNVGLLSYQNSGQINLAVQTYDYNPLVAGYIPACPNLYSVRVTSSTRTTADTFTMPFTNGGATFDLMQGAYRMQLHNLTSGGVFWDEVLAVAPGASPTRSVDAPAVNSSTTPLYPLTVSNAFGVTVAVYNFSTLLGTITTGTSANYSVRGCSQITIRNNTTNGLVDVFEMPMNLSAYVRNLNATPLSFTITNNTGTYRYLFVFVNDLLIGQVSGLGNRKIKTFRNLRAGDVVTVRDPDGNIVGTFTLPSAGSTVF